MDENTKESVLYDPQDCEEFIDLLLSCDDEDSRLALESEALD